MSRLRWLLILAAMPVGVFTPWSIQLVALLALLMGYAACFRLNWPNFQLALAYLYGGLATGLGLQFLIAYGIKDHVVQMIVVPLLIWLVARIFYYALETHYTLHPNAAVTQMRLEDAQAAREAQGHTDPDPKLEDVIQQGTSAWQDSTSGMAEQPGPDGYNISYHYESTGEIAMGGPTYGDVVFNNRCAIAGVGPSIVLSEDGHYAVMTVPSRTDWRTLVADLQEKVIYEAHGEHSFWELDSLKNGMVTGRFSPLTANQRIQCPLDTLIKEAKRSAMVQDDGWWLMDYEGRKPLPTYEAVTIYSQTKLHRVTFVPDLKPFKDNPFKRFQAPTYSVLVDDVLQTLEVRTPSALWVNDIANDANSEGRFLVIDGQVLDFHDAVQQNQRNPKPKLLELKLGDTLTSMGATTFTSAEDGVLHIKATVHPRSTGWNEAEFVSYSTTYPWDEESSHDYWDANGQQQQQARSCIEQYVDYLVDLPKLSYVQHLALCARIQRTSRSNQQHQAQWQYAGGVTDDALYLAYTLTTSCGIQIDGVTLEAVWSHCGRYLAVVHYADKPQLPHRISIIDFTSATVRQVSNDYVLPSFIWMDQNMLELTHIVALQETINYGYNRENKVNTIRLNDPNTPKNVYTSLFTDRAKRQVELEQLAAQSKTGDYYTAASVDLLAQHCILFAPDFDQAVPQPPTQQTT
jgi:hypothetical protein